MFKRRRHAVAPAYVGDHLDRLSRVRPLALDYEEMPTREDRGYGHTLFTRIVLPVYLRRS
jgi:hypothetical protein